MKKITLFSVLAVMFAALSFTSCNTDSDNDSSLPSPTEAKAMLNAVAGYHSCGILFPGNNSTSESSKIEKDSVASGLRINASDSTFIITDFPVKCLAKYINDESLSQAVAALPNQNLQGKLYPYSGSASSPLFCTLTQNIDFTVDGKSVSLKFYGGYNPYALAGYASSSTSSSTTSTPEYFVMYLTPGAIYVNDEYQSNALKVANNSNYGTNSPYIIYLRYNL